MFSGTVFSTAFNHSLRNAKKTVDIISVIICTRLYQTVSCFTVMCFQYACDVTAEVVGKPAPSFFLTALEDMGIPANQVHGVRKFSLRFCVLLFRMCSSVHAYTLDRHDDPHSFHSYTMFCFAGNVAFIGGKPRCIPKPGKNILSHLATIAITQCDTGNQTWDTVWKATALSSEQTRQPSVRLCISLDM